MRVAGAKCAADVSAALQETADHLHWSVGYAAPYFMSLLCGSYDKDQRFAMALSMMKKSHACANMFDLNVWAFPLHLSNHWVRALTRGWRAGGDLVMRTIRALGHVLGAGAVGVRHAGGDHHGRGLLSGPAARRPASRGSDAGGPGVAGDGGRGVLLAGAWGGAGWRVLKVNHCRERLIQCADWLCEVGCSDRLLVRSPRSGVCAHNRTPRSRTTTGTVGRS